MSHKAAAYVLGTAARSSTIAANLGSHQPTGSSNEQRELIPETFLIVPLIARKVAQRA